ncbi:hypothetical protein CONLIGDRAFT_188889 [Coniochaeta ligniaria NRRL 30616]|uniref:DUF7137 domain-containing protein n=1 Tax=Coniochaeta ligniaria NRRL 30616 TaxID=1408157 RepID=A0A1J7JK03_9PEZI|nr:hypothetical protein CONLIGDRAFT_188889 [Coniochaeta ligniaria NRRL 30616]
MKTTLSVGQLATIALSLSPLAAAWPSWPRWLPDIDSLVVRQDDSSSSNSTSATASPSQTGTAKSQPVTTKNLNTAGIEPTGTGNSTNTKTAAATHTEYPAQDAAGNVVMVTPAATQVATNLYKIGENITWGWNYTNLQGTPTAIDVLVSILSTATFTLTQNMTFETPGVFEWDTKQYEEDNVGQPLLTEQYTLVIYDADGSPTQTAEAGYLAPFSGFKFGLYQPKGATPLADWSCATCSAALGSTERRAIGMAAAMSVVTVLSFTWFVVGFGALL